LDLQFQDNELGVWMRDRMDGERADRGRAAEMEALDDSVTDEKR
jgi:hypothetical protein